MRFLPLLLLTFLWSCTDSTNQEPTTETTPATNPAPVPAAKLEAIYPAYPVEKLQYLFENSDYIDYVFYELPMSMSLSEKASIQYSISHVSAEQAPINANCKSLGRIFYQLKGENVAEAEIVFNAPEQCSYFVFYDNGKKAYANQMTEAGIKYLQQNIMNAVKSMQQAQQQGQGQGQ
ncbi:MAG: hypothetical protein ACI9XO_001146 [Paraglaciecola sp.]|jgi:hypothetical protein